MAVAWGHLPATCVRSGCSPIPELRQKFGCDEGVPGNPGTLPFCWACNGGEPDCSLCGGEGKVYIPRCTRRCLTPEVVAMVEAYGHYRDGFLPIAGGMLDQSLTFCAAVRLLASVYAQHEEIESKRGR